MPNSNKLISTYPAKIDNNLKMLDYNLFSNNKFIALDLETTGLSSKTEKIIEIGAVKVINGEIVDSFNTLINPQIVIKKLITNLTGIDNTMVKNSPTIEEVLPSFIDFIEDYTLVAHNANFDMGFLKTNAQRMNLEINNPVEDTVKLSRQYLPKLTNHKLNTVADYLKICLNNHHRAMADCIACAQIYLKILQY